MWYYNYRKREENRKENKMIIVKNKKRAIDFRIFNNRLEAIEWIESLSRKDRKNYIIVKPKRNPFEVV